MCSRVGHWFKIQLFITALVFLSRWVNRFWASQTHTQQTRTHTYTDEHIHTLIKHIHLRTQTQPLPLVWAPAWSVHLRSAMSTDLRMDLGTCTDEGICRHTSALVIIMRKCVWLVLCALVHRRSTISAPQLVHCLYRNIITENKLVTLALPPLIFPTAVQFVGVCTFFVLTWCLTGVAEKKMASEKLASGRPRSGTSPSRPHPGPARVTYFAVASAMVS
jgi:hypothetical protein